MIVFSLPVLFAVISRGGDPDLHTLGRFSNRKLHQHARTKGALSKMKNTSAPRS